jgi:hypothetical protein
MRRRAKRRLFIGVFLSEVIPRFYTGAVFLTSTGATRLQAASPRRPQRQSLPFVLAVYVKIAIQRPYNRALMKLGHADEARIGIRHGAFAIAFHERTHRTMFTFEVECYAQEPGLDEVEKIVCLVTVALEKEQRFGDDSFAGQHRWRRVFALFDRPAMPIVVADQKCDERTRVDKPGRHLP